MSESTTTLAEMMADDELRGSFGITWTDEPGHPCELCIPKGSSGSIKVQRLQHVECRGDDLAYLLQQSVIEAQDR